MASSIHVVYFITDNIAVTLHSSSFFCESKTE